VVVRPPACARNSHDESGRLARAQPTEAAVQQLCTTVKHKTKLRFRQIAVWLRIAEPTVAEWITLVQVSTPSRRFPSPPFLGPISNPSPTSAPTHA